jgi:hypothetical protein
VVWQGASIGKFKDKSGQRILNLEGEIVWSSLIQEKLAALGKVF